MSDTTGQASLGADVTTQELNVVNKTTFAIAPSLRPIQQRSASRRPAGSTPLCVLH